MTLPRRLIVNADDFGLSEDVNAGIIAAHRHGIVTSASVMVRWPAARDAAQYAATNANLSLGLHLDLGEWQYIGGDWQPLYEVVPLSDAAAVEQETARQIEVFRELLGRKPSHLDSHQHVHRHEPVASVVIAAGRRLGMPVRHFSEHVRYCGEFYGQTGEGLPWPEGITVAALTRILAELRPGTTELACHPGWDDGLQTMYCRQRREEVRVLCDSEARQAIVAEGIELISFADLLERE